MNRTQQMRSKRAVPISAFTVTGVVVVLLAMFAMAAPRPFMLGLNALGVVCIEGPAYDALDSMGKIAANLKGLRILSYSSWAAIVGTLLVLYGERRRFSR